MDEAIYKTFIAGALEIAILAFANYPRWHFYDVFGNKWIDFTWTLFLATHIQTDLILGLSLGCLERTTLRK